MMRHQLQILHDEEYLKDTDDGGNIDDESSTTSTITNSIMNDNDEEYYNNIHHSGREKIILIDPILSRPTPEDIVSLYSLISHDDVIGIQELILSLSISSSSCTENNDRNNGEDKSIEDNEKTITPMNIVNCVLNDYGYTPVIVAVLFGHIETARCLLNDYGADINIAATNGQTALHYAVKCPLIESIELIKLLLHHSNTNSSSNHHHCSTSLINRQDYNGNTPLHYVSSVQVLRLLLRYDANVQTRNNIGEIPLHRAVKYTPYEVVKELLYYPSTRCHRHRLTTGSSNDNVGKDDDNGKSDNHHYDYDRIHGIKADNGMTPYDTIFHCQSVLDVLGLLDSLRVRLFCLFNQYENEQQQIKRNITYSYVILSCPELDISNNIMKNIVSIIKEKVVVREGEEGVVCKKQKMNKE